MKAYIVRRLGYMVLLMLLVSIFSFIVIQLPPGDYVSAYISRVEAEMGTVDPETVEALRKAYGLDKGMVEQYFFWMGNILKGDFGQSFEWKRPVVDLILDRLPMTLLLSILTTIVTYLLAIPIGIYSARKQYSVMDYVFTVIGFIGLATPSFFLALVLMFFSSSVFGVSVGGINSPEFINAAFSWGKVWDTIKHLPIPVFVIGFAGIASTMRVMRSTLLDELKRPYVVAARARGLEENRMIYRYPVRVALNPIISSIGWMLPNIVSGMTVTGIVLNIPTIGTLLYNALLSQDMYLSGACIMILSFLTVIGMFISDLLLMLIDPRIRVDQ
ncbi:MAG: ABC transporter permease [Clostridiales bacterium]|nr:ABC transporter permease [Clostridiales bacterium]